jgi:hypothetical protein
MEIKKEDFKRFRIVDTFFYALPVSFFEAPKGEPLPMDKVAEAMENKEEIEIIIEEPEPEPTEEELAEIEKEKKRAELQAQIDAL